MTDPTGAPDWTRLLAAARHSLERSGGSLDGTISLTNPSDAERRIIIGVTGVHRSISAARLAVRLADLDAYVTQLTGRPLAEVAARAAGTPCATGPRSARTRRSHEAPRYRSRTMAYTPVNRGIRAGSTRSAGTGR